jgi:hypothetical protein
MVAGLQIVVDCKNSPMLYRLKNPAKTLNFEDKTKGVQFFFADGCVEA